MSDLALALYADLDAEKLVNSEGATLTLPDPKLGDTWVCSLRFLNRLSNSVRERDLNVTALRASIGPAPLTPPASGSFKLDINGTITSAIPMAADAAALLTALGAAGVSVEKPDTGCWLAILTQGDDPLPCSAADDSVSGYNTLNPQSFVRVRAFRRNDTWYHEIRLIQTPYAFIDLNERILPPAPTIERVSAGGPATEEAPAHNEIQKLRVPSDFRSSYYLRFASRRSSVLTPFATPDDIAVALNAMYGGSAVNFAVTNPEFEYAYIEFIGDLAGRSQDLLTLSINTTDPGVLTFRLDLGEAALADALRATPTASAFFEVEIEYVGDNEDPEADGVVPKRKTLWQQPVTCRREGIWAELATIPATNWLRPPSPRKYIPYDPSTVITGQQHYVHAFGDGAASIYSFSHGLATEAISGIVVRQNSDGGAVLVQGTDYDVVIVSADEVEITCAAIPASNALVVCITSAGPKSAFVDDLTIAIEQVTGLRDELDNLAERMAAVEGALPTLSIADSSVASSGSRSIQIDDFVEILPRRAQTGTPDLAHPPALLPAIHDASTADLTPPFPALAENIGVVLQNNTGDRVLVPGGGGRTSAYLEDGGFVGCDGRYWYRVNQQGTTTSYYPRDFEREFFLLPILAQEWKAGEIFQLTFDLELRLLVANTRAQYLVVIEHGVAASEASPSTTGTNLKTITWNATPILSLQLFLTQTLRKHHFGVRVKRSAEDAITSEKLLYSAWTAGGSAPASGAFFLRARIIEFDVQDDVATPKGYVSVKASAISGNFI